MIAHVFVEQYCKKRKEKRLKFVAEMNMESFYVGQIVQPEKKVQLSEKVFEYRKRKKYAVKHIIKAEPMKVICKEYIAKGNLDLVNFLIM